MTPTITYKAAAAVAIIEAIAPSKSFLLLRRTKKPGDPWSGHFSFPGGRKETCDKTILDTCLRETCEETGINLPPDSLVRALPMAPAGRTTGNSIWVQPFLFRLDTRPQLLLEKEEVASAFWLDAERFLNRHNHREVEMVPGIIFPALPIDDYYLWGFTYRLLDNVLAMAEK